MIEPTIEDEENHPAVVEIRRLQESNEITPELAKSLLFKFSKLHNAFVHACGVEQTLMRRTRNLNKELKAQKVSIENSAHQQQEHRVQLSNLRQNVTITQADLESVKEQITLTKNNTKLKHKEREKLEEKVTHAQENQRVKLDPKKRQIQEENASLEELITQRKEKIQSLIKNQQEIIEKIQRCEAQLSQLETKKKEKNKRILDISVFPMKIRQKANASESALNSLLAEEKSALSMLEKTETDISNILSVQRDKETEIQQVTNDLNGMTDAVDQVKRKYEKILSDSALQKDVRLHREYELKTISKSIKESNSQISSLDAKQDGLLKEIDKKDIEILKMEEAISHYKKQRESLLSQLNNVEKEANNERQRNINYQAELDRVTQAKENALKAVLALETVNSKLLQQIKDALREKNKKQAVLDIHIQKEKDLIHSLKENALMRTRKARELTNMKRKAHDSKNLAIERNLNYLDQVKKLEAFSQKLIEVSQLYEKAKVDRNRYVNAIQTSRQLNVEIKEKIKILDNEVEVLRTEFDQVDAAVRAQKHLLNDAYKRREATKSQLRTEEENYKKLQRQIDHQVTETGRMNSILQKIEDLINNQQNRYTIQADDCANIQRMLIDKQDELCIVYEQYNRHEEVMRYGEQILKEKEEELRLLNIQLNDFARKIDIFQRKIPQLKKYNSDIDDLQRQIDRERKDVDDLTRKLEIPDENERKRLYCGRDFSAKELDAKVSHYEQRVKDKEMQIAEQQIILRDINERIEGLRGKSQKLGFKSNHTLEKGGNIRAETMKLRRKKMAALSEMAIYQAQQDDLQEQKEAVKEEIKQAESRTARGEAFDEYAEKIVRMHERDIKTAQTPRRKSIFDEEDDEEEKQPGRQKFDAYPTADGLSRPYGAFPVFQPGDPSPNLRYYRKEDSRPIVL